MVSSCWPPSGSPGSLHHGASGRPLDSAPTECTVLDLCRAPHAFLPSQREPD